MKNSKRLIMIFLLVVTIISSSACTSDQSGIKTDNESPVTSGINTDIVKENSKDKENAKPSESGASSQSPEDNDFGTMIEVKRDESKLNAIALSDIDQYSLNKRLLGLIDGSNPHGIEDYTNGIVAMEHSFMLNNRYKDDIIEGIKLGDSFKDIISKMGSPGWDTGDKMFYRSENYSILFQGEYKAESVILFKEANAEYDKDILKKIIMALNDNKYNSLEESIKEIDSEEAFFTDKANISGGGYYALSQLGIIIVDSNERYIEVYNNFDGILYDYKSENQRYELRFIDKNLTIETIMSDLVRYWEIEELFAAEGVLSPNKKLSAVFERSNGTDQHFIIRTLDHTMQDRYIYSNISDEYYWLGNNHILYIDSYNSIPYAFDIDFSRPGAINILYEAGILKDRDLDSGEHKYKITEISENTIFILDNDSSKTYKVEFSEDKNGEIVFKEV